MEHPLLPHPQGPHDILTMVSATPKAQADQAQHVGLLLGCRSAQQGGWFEKKEGNVAKCGIFSHKTRGFHGE